MEIYALFGLVLPHVVRKCFPSRIHPFTHTHTRSQICQCAKSVSAIFQFPIIIQLKWNPKQQSSDTDASTNMQCVRVPVVTVARNIIIVVAVWCGWEWAHSYRTDICPPTKTSATRMTLSLSLFASFTGIGHASNRTRFVLCTGACITNKTAIVSALAHTRARSQTFVK